MNEIRVRVWDTVTQEMYYQDDVMFFLDRDGITTMYDTCSQFLDIGEKSEKLYMQYVGLKDKNGVAIYHNDIISFIFDGEAKVSLVRFSVLTGAMVTFNSLGSTYTFNLSSVFESERDITIIGNYYKNKYLVVK